jgi:UDP-glucose 4-epimerase
MKCLVTGACGFIGVNLCEILLQEGHEVVGLDNFSVGKPHELLKTCNEFDKFQLLKIDFSNKTILESISNIYKTVDVIYHLGGMSGVRESIEKPDVWFQHNVVGTFNILEVARKFNIKKVVMAASSACIGDTLPPIHEDIHMKPISPYGASKGCKELYTTAYFHSYGMDVTALRFSNVYGPHSTIKVSLVAKFIRKILFNEELNIYGNGDQTRDFIYVKDLLDALQLAADKKVGGEIFQISTGVETSVNQMTELICEQMKKYGFKIPSINHTDPVIGDIMTNYADNSKAKSMLDWYPKVNIEEGLKQTIEWFIKEVKK